jgi:hypothetical protein
MMNWFKAFDKNYPFILIAMLIFLGGLLIYLRAMDYIERPIILGYAMVGEGLFLLYKRYIKQYK